MKTEKELVDWIEELIDVDELWRLYKSKEFRKLKEEVLREQHHECIFHLSSALFPGIQST